MSGADHQGCRQANRRWARGERRTAFSSPVTAFRTTTYRDRRLPRAYGHRRAGVAEVCPTAADGADAALATPRRIDGGTSRTVDC